MTRVVVLIVEHLAPCDGVNKVIVQTHVVDWACAKPRSCTVTASCWSRKTARRRGNEEHLKLNEYLLC